MSVEFKNPATRKYYNALLEQDRRIIWKKHHYEGMLSDVTPAVAEAIATTTSLGWIEKRSTAKNDPEPQPDKKNK